MKSKSLQAVSTKTSSGPSVKPFFQKKADTEADGAFFQLPQQQGLSVGKPDSKYEKEADSMAEQVVGNFSQSSDDQASVTPLYSKVTPLVQRQSTEEEEELQAKVQRQGTEEEEELQAKVQRQSTKEEEELQAKAQRQGTETASAQAIIGNEEIQRRLGDSTGLSTQPDLAGRLKSAKGQGNKLEGPVRSRMEAGFGADFSEVRVHTDTRAEALSESLNAHAFTVGRDVFFNKNKFRPDTPDGDQLLAHELTHTIHQGAVLPKKETAEEVPSNKNTETATAPETSKETIAAETTPPVSTEAAPPPEAGALGENTPEENQAVEAADEPPYPRSPEENPAFQQTQENLNRASRQERSHQPAEQASAGAQSAAPSPDNERLSIAQAGQVEEMNQGAENKGKFDAEKFKSLLLEQIARILPENEDEADDFAESNEMDTVKSAASSQAAAEKENAAGSIEQATEKEPDENSVPERETTPLQPEQAGAQPGSIGASGAMPPPRGESEVSQPLQENMQEVDDVFAEEEVTDEQLARSNEPDFLAARDAQNEARDHTQTAPHDFRQEEGDTLSGARQAAQSDSANQLGSMHNEREGLLGEVEERQQNTMDEDSTERARVAGEINAIFERTKTDVEGILESLDAEVEADFDTGEANARQQFEDYVERKMDDYMDERYGGITGFARRVGDVFTGLPDEVNRFFTEGRDLYIRIMDGALTNIAQNVADKLNEAQLRITEGRQEVADYVAALPEDLQSVGQEASEDIQSKFDSLESDIESKQDELITGLATRYKQSLEAVDARIEEMKEANKGLIDKAIGFAKKVIQVIRDIKNTILGLISAAIAAIKAIIADPIGFLGNLISGISQGIDNFFSNIWDHLLGGLFQWLTGALGPLNITIPENLFSLQGAFDLVRQVLGLTYDFIREQAVKVFGEDVVRVIETSLELLVVFAKGGLMAVWEYIKDKLNDLKEAVIDAIMNMTITEVIKAGIKWLLGLLNPASAFVKAALAIIDIVKFFIQRGRQILALVEAFTQAILEIASGNVSKVAAAIENALARAVPVLIGFLASLLGISGLVGKVQKLIQKVRERIGNAIRSVLEKIKSLAFKLFSTLTGKGKKGEEDPEEVDTAKTSDGQELGDTEVGETVKFTAEGESHKLWINTAGSGVEVMVASAPMTVGEKLDQWEGRLNELDDDNRKEASPLITQARTQYKKTRDSGTVAEREMDEATASTDVDEMEQAETADDRVESDEAVLKGQLKRLFELFGEEIIDLSNFEASYQNQEGENHTIQFEEKDVEIPDLMRYSSSPVSIKKFLEDKKDEISGDITLEEEEKTHLLGLLNEGKNIVDEIRSEIIAVRGAPSPDPNWKNELNVRLRRLKEIVKEIDRKAIPVPPMVVNPPFSNAIKSRELEIENIHKEHGDRGSDPDGDLFGAWSLLEDMGINANWVRFHIFNNEIGGKGVASNLIPTRRTDNNNYKDEFETPLKDDSWKKNKPLWFYARVTYHGEFDKFPIFFKAEAGEMKVKGKNWATSNEGYKSWTKNMDLPTSDLVFVNRLSTNMDDLALQIRNTPLTKELARRIGNKGAKNIGELKNIVKREATAERTSSKQVKGRDPEQIPEDIQRRMDAWLQQIEATKFDFSE